MSFLEIYFICHEFQVKEQLRDAKGAHAHYMACHATHTVTGGPPLNLFRIKISDNKNDDATAADTTAADDEDDDCDNDYIHSLTITDRGNIEHLLCSRKWANPGMSSGSEKLPAPMQRAAADWEDEEIKYCYLR